jgi:hypothetical protein
VLAPLDGAGQCRLRALDLRRVGER